MQAYRWHWESKSRYFSIRLQKNLFGDWSLLKSWGGLRNKLGGMKIETFDSLDDAVNEVSYISKVRCKRSYQLIIMQ